MCSNNDDFNNRNLFLTAKLFKQGYRYNKIRKAFLNSTTDTKTLLQQSISVPIYYGDLFYKFKTIVGKQNFSDQFNKIIKRYIKVGYNLDVCLLGFEPNHGF